jgi:hypothetical protein
MKRQGGKTANADTVAVESRPSIAQKPVLPVALLARHNVTFKKTAHASEQDRPDVKLARQVWRDNQRILNPEHLISLDETGVSTNMARIRGRCAGGERLIGKVPHGHWNITTFIAGRRCAGWSLQW